MYTSNISSLRRRKMINKKVMRELSMEFTFMKNESEEALIWFLLLHNTKLSVVRQKVKKKIYILSPDSLELTKEKESGVGWAKRKSEFSGF